MLSEYAAAGGQYFRCLMPSPKPSAFIIDVLCAHLGFPIGTLPLSYLKFNGRPVGLLVAAQRHQDSNLIKVMSAWEATFDPRQPPEEFLKHTTV